MQTLTMYVAFVLDAKHAIVFLLIALVVSIILIKMELYVKHLAVEDTMLMTM
jgi:hypothetical protein